MSRPTAPDRPCGGTVHVIGAGLAGLSAAVRLTAAGLPVIVHEASGQAGGRCRSYRDPVLDCLIDNGNHLMLSANEEILSYLRLLEAEHGLLGAEDPARFPMLDLATGARFTIRPSRGRIPWWVLRARTRIPETGVREYLGGWRLATAGPGHTVADRIRGRGTLWRAFWEPLCLGVMNLPPERAAARPLYAVLRRSFLNGEGSCRPLVAREGLGPALVDPAIRYLARHGAEIRYHARVKTMRIQHGRVTGLGFGAEDLPLGPDDRAILAVPPGLAGQLLGRDDFPEEGVEIVNAHFRLDHPVRFPDGAHLLGLIGSEAQWLFRRRNVVSVTVSAADRLSGLSAPETARLLWRDVARALDLPTEHPPPHRIVKERRATFTQTPANIAKRPGTAGGLANLALAGDWTETGLPATIEGAVLSGRRAAEAAGAGRARPIGSETGSDPTLSPAPNSPDAVRS